MRLMNADKYCEFLNTYPLEKAQSNFMTFYRDALQHTFEYEVKAIPIEWIKKEIGCSIEAVRDKDYDYTYASCILQLLERWEKENETN